MKLKIFPILGAKYTQVKCSGLIDQNRFIGDDPVGRACFEKATLLTDTGHFLCEKCESLLSTGRITLPPARYREAEYISTMGEPNFIF